MSQQLATIKTDVPDLDFALEKCRVKPFDRDQVLALFQKFEFVSLLKRLPEFGKINPPLGEEKGAKKEKKTARPSKTKVQITFHDVHALADARAAKDVIKETKRYAARIITSGDNFFTAKLEQLVVVVNDQAYGIAPEWWDEIKDIFEDEAIELGFR